MTRMIAKLKKRQSIKKYPTSQQNIVILFTACSYLIHLDVTFHSNFSHFSINKRVFYFSSDYECTFVIAVENELEKYFQELKNSEKKKLEEEKLKQEIKI